MGESEDTEVWVRDDRGRVGRLLDANRICYASGEQEVSCDYIVISDAFTAQHDFAKQCDEMWLVVYECTKLNERVLAKCLRHREGFAHGSLAREELLADVGVKTIQRAALLYDAARCGASLKGYVAQCLKRAYHKALNQRREPDAAYGHGGDDSNSSQRAVGSRFATKCKLLGGLESSEQLSSILEQAGVTAEELDLLLARYDSDLTLRDLADQIGVSSPQTVLNVIRRILERCRKVAS